VDCSVALSVLDPGIGLVFQQVLYTPVFITGTLLGLVTGSKLHTWSQT
jgi:hypothetical protein